MDSPRLGPSIRAKIFDRENDSYVSVVSLWEATIKARTGKLEIDARSIVESVGPSGFKILGLDASHLRTLGELPRFREHNDPFDHLLIAQAMSENMTFVSDDEHVSVYPVRSLPCRP